jgi:hypothetical protein
MDATSHKKILKSRDTPARKSIFPRDETFPPAENSLFLPVTRFHLEEIRFSSRRKPFTDGKSIFLPGETFLPARNSLFPPTMHFHLEEIRFSPRRKPSADGQWTFRSAQHYRRLEIPFFVRQNSSAGRKFDFSPGGSLSPAGMVIGATPARRSWSRAQFPRSA